MSRESIVTLRSIAAVALLFAAAPALQARAPLPRILVQDPALDNLLDPPGYQTAPLGTLGGVVKSGGGPQAVILVPGLGFGGHVFDELVGGLGDGYTFYAVTLPGFGGSAAAPSPPATTSFGAQTWTNGALAAIEKLIADEKIERPIVVGHWLTGTQIALRLALAHPESVRGVVVLAGAGRLHFTDPKRNEMLAKLENRVAGVDRFAQGWFKTVTRETWDDNNFLPGDYAVHPTRGLRLWREAARPDLHVWVRWLCEFNAQDVTLELAELAVPTLFLEPGFEGAFFEEGQNYMASYLHDSWGASREGNPRIRVQSIPDARVALWSDQPEATRRAIVDFLAALPPL
jgi:pimeloyl-ACP methyl ester carboxylesterase